MEDRGRRHAVQQGMAGRRHPAPRAERGRHGRRAHLRDGRRPACRHQFGRHDGRLGAPALRLPCRGIEQHHPQRARREPRLLRHFIQAAFNYRVGIKLNRLFIGKNKN